MSNVEIYTIGWLCGGVLAELIAAQEFLDEEHETPSFTERHDANSYTLGRMGKHNVVIATLGENGIAAAAITAKSMSFTFPNLRFCLMVGIGGGVPSKHDIRLGDVVVSEPTYHNGSNYGGVVQFDYGKTIRSGTFQSVKYLNQPPLSLRTTMRNLKSRYKRHGSHLNTTINSILARNPRLQDEYTRPNPDKLSIGSSHTYPDGSGSSALCKTSLPNAGHQQTKRENPDEPEVHYGLIASADTFMEDGHIRDILSEELDVLCFEMEAAGLMNDFPPCLVIRGICDCADESWSTVWRGYASMTAAAYAKDLLQLVVPYQVEAEERMSDVLSGLQKGINYLTDHQRDEDHKDLLDWLSSADYSLNQNQFWQTRQDDTCLWFFDQPEFKYWEQTPGQLLCGSGFPGVGKTFVAATVIDHLQENCLKSSSVGLGYFYCDYQRHHEQRAEHILANILKQLVYHRPDLVQSVKELNQRHQKKQSRPSLSEIMAVLRLVVPNFARVFIVVDAVDECNKMNGSQNKLLRELSNIQKELSVNILITVRKDIVDIKPWFDNIGSVEILAPDCDIIRYLNGQEDRLPLFITETHGLVDQIIRSIVAAAQGIFLLAQLAFTDVISKTSVHDIKATLRNLPSGSDAYHEAYAIAMARIQQQPASHNELANIIFSWMTYATRPITIMELRLALATRAGQSPLDKTALTDINTMLVVCCGLVTIDQETKVIRLVHYTTKLYFEQLLHKSSLTTEADLAKTCIKYLLLDEFASGRCGPVATLQERLSTYRFYEYAAIHWAHHLRNAAVLSTEAIEFLMCFPKADASAQILAFGGYEDFETYDAPREITGLHLAAFFGLLEAVEYLIQHIDINQGDEELRTPLMYASTNGHEEVVQFLITNKAQTDLDDAFGRTPLSLAALSGHEGVAKLLIHSGVKIDTASLRDAATRIPRTPLSYAAEAGHERLVELLLKHDAKVNAATMGGWTALTLASSRGHEGVVKLLLAAGATVNPLSGEKRTPLFYAAVFGHMGVAELLLENGAICDWKDSWDIRPIEYAAIKGHIGIVILLVTYGSAPADDLRMLNRADDIIMADDPLFEGLGAC